MASGRNIQKKNTHRGKRVRRFTKSNLINLAMLYLVFIILFAGLSLRILYIQETKGEEYSARIKTESNLTSITIPFRRGNITDRNGTLLATSEKVYNIVFDCSVINDELSDRNYILTTLCEFCPDLDRTELERLLDENPTAPYNIIRYSQSYEQIKELKKALDDDENYENFNGIWLEEKYKRLYPFGTLACDVIGFLNNDGSSPGIGLEGYYDDELNGVNGRKYQYISDNSKETVVKEAEDGKNIVTTIDYNIQSIVEKHIKAFDDAHLNEVREGNGAEGIYVMLADPNNGEILAEANYPYFDLNDPKNLAKTSHATAASLEIDTSQLTTEEALAISNEKNEILNKIWRNFCVSDSFEPGSTQKPFTVAIGLETGALNGDEIFICDGAEQVGGHKIRCVNRSGHGEETISMAISNSCNDVLMQIAQRIGIQNFIRYQNLWGFGKKTNIDLPSEFNCSSLIYTEKTMHETELATSSFGQGYNVTMTQMMAAFCSLINGGNYYQPHVVKKVTDSDGATIKNVDSYLVRKTISKETSEIVKSYLYDTVMNGTAKTAHVEGYTMGGKTGTAEKAPRDKSNYVVSFIGYAPADNPQVAIYVVIDTPNVADQAHSSFAQQIAHDIMAEVLPYMNIFPDMEVEQTPQEGEDTITVPAEDGATDTTVPAEDGAADTTAPAESQDTDETAPAETDTGVSADNPVNTEAPQQDDYDIFDDNITFPLLDE